MKAGQEELSLLSDVGDITAKAIVDYFKDPKNLEDIERFPANTA